MPIPFLDRNAERAQLIGALHAKSPSLAVVYGRRRCGKSRLLREVCTDRDIYFLADTRETPLQIRSLAVEIARRVPGFAEAEYSSWEGLLRSLSRQIPHGRTNVFLDEFPYLVQLDSSLPSVLQRLVDEGLRVGLVLCGSSQRMMQGLVLDHSAPLYGRATRIVKVQPLLPGWIEGGLKVKGDAAVEAYSVWGGVPRYWELAAEYTNLADAVRDLVLDRTGVLHDEPQRLLMDDMRSSAQPHSLLSLVATGCHRLSELAGRLGKPAGHLARPLDNLIELGYVRREVPFGESVKSTRRSLYRLEDPFLQFWYRFVQPNRSLLELGRLSHVAGAVASALPAHVAGIWEHMCRLSIAFDPIDGVEWKPGQRWWGVALDGKPHEIDLVAESVDGRHILLGEAKWESGTGLPAECERLRGLANLLPAARGKIIHVACWVRTTAHRTRRPPCPVRYPRDVVSVMR